MRKLTLILAGIFAVLLIFLLVGVFSGRLARISDKIVAERTGVEVKFEIPPEAIANISSLKPNQIIYGIVKSKNQNQIGISAVLVNPLNSQDIREIPIAIALGSQDEIRRFQKISDEQPLKETAASFEDINIGDFITIRILENKKVVYLPTK